MNFHRTARDANLNWARIYVSDTTIIWVKYTSRETSWLAARTTTERRCPCNLFSRACIRRQTFNDGTIGLTGNRSRRRTRRASTTISFYPMNARSEYNIKLYDTYKVRDLTESKEKKNRYGEMTKINKITNFTY